MHLNRSLSGAFVDRGNNIYGMHRIEHDANDDAVSAARRLDVARRDRS